MQYAQRIVGVEVLECLAAEDEGHATLVAEVGNGRRREDEVSNGEAAHAPLLVVCAMARDLRPDDVDAMIAHVQSLQIWKERAHPREVAARSIDYARDAILRGRSG